MVSGTTSQRADTVGFRGQSGNEQIVIDRTKHVENQGHTLDETKLETVTREGVRVTQNPEHARQEDAAVCGMNRAQRGVAGHVAGPPGLADGQAERLENRRDVHTDENARRNAGCAGRAKLATQAQENAAEMPPRGGDFGHPAGKTPAVKGGVVNRPGLRCHLPGKNGKRREDPIRARTAGRTGNESTGRELGQHRRKRPARPRTGSAGRNDRSNGRRIGTRRGRNIGESHRAPDGTARRTLGNEDRAIQMAGRARPSMDGSKPASMTSWSYWPDLGAHRGGMAALRRTAERT